jgi:DNA-binding CsgD family transcriptional regulator
VDSTAHHVRASIARLAVEPGPPAEFGLAISAAVRQLLPFDGWCLIGLDPHSGLRTFQLSQNGTVSSCTEVLARNEAMMPDVNLYSYLARAQKPAGWLSRDHPRAPTSFRLNEILRPQGIHSEMRIALREGSRLWGALVLFRSHRGRLFDEADASRASSCAGPLAQAVRHYPVRRFPSRPQPIGQGVVLLAPDNRMIAMSTHAQSWLADLVPGGGDETGPEDVLRVVFDAANAARGHRNASATMRTVSGRWLTVEGVALTTGAADVAVLMQAAHVTQIVPSLQAHHGLTPRETHILDQVVDGRPSKQIAHRLDISLLTVNTHLTSIYRKCGVTGREELFAQLQ